MLCFIILAYAFWKDSAGCSRASVAGLARLARLALEPPVRVPVVPIARPEVPAVERLLTLLALGAGLRVRAPGRCGDTWLVKEAREPRAALDHRVNIDLRRRRI